MTRKPSMIAVALLLWSCGGGGAPAAPDTNDDDRPAPGVVAVGGEAASPSFTLSFRIEPGGLTGRARGANFGLGGHP